MNLRTLALGPQVVWGALALASLVTACKDEDPCDPGQVEKHGQCYEVAGSGGSSASGGAGGASGGITADSAGSGGASEGPDAPALDTAFGTACLDTTTFSDCGGTAPICADLSQLGQSKMCTQLNCNPGEANAGACPAAFTCFAAPGYPSFCLKN